MFNFPVSYPVYQFNGVSFFYFDCATAEGR